MALWLTRGVDRRYHGLETTLGAKDNHGMQVCRYSFTSSKRLLCASQLSPQPSISPLPTIILPARPALTDSDLSTGPIRYQLLLWQCELSCLGDKA